ncbi:MAG: TonB-dependent receptor [Gemmatimonadetes bacterium]|nr:TonB-dependent receptor [Gemmatimonadota bacterium]
MRRTWIWLAGSLLWATPAGAQMPHPPMPHPMMHEAGRITGMCRMAGGTPVEGVRVRIADANVSAMTGADGRFSLGPLPRGQYVVEIARIGFRPARRTVDLASPRDTVIDFDLIPAPVTVDAVVVEAFAQEDSRTHELANVLRVPPVGTANVSTVTPHDIAAVHARDPWDLLRQTTGLEVHHQGQGPGFASNAVIRGFTSDHSADVALMIDGVPVNEPVNGHQEGLADWNLLLADAIADVQVIKGPISPLFGNFAAGGAVNVNTKASAAHPSVGLEGGSYGYTAGTATTGFERGPWGGFFALRGARTAGWRENSGYRIGQLLARANRRISSALLLDASAQLYGTDWSSPGYLSLPDFEQGLFTLARDPTDGGDKWRAAGRLAAQLTTDRLSWQTNLWAYRSRWSLFLNIPSLGSEMEGLGTQTEDLDHRSALGLKSVTRWTTGPWEFLAGVEAQRQHANYDLYQTVERVRDLTMHRYTATFLNGAAFASAATTLGRVVRVEGALRTDLLGVRTTDQLTRTSLPEPSHQVLSPKFGAVYYARPDWHFYGSVARGFRSAPGFIRDPTLDPVSVWAFEAGSRFARRTFQTSASVFRLETTRERLLNPITLRVESDGRSIREGIEVELSVRPVQLLQLHTHWTLNTKGVFFLPDSGMSVIADRLALQLTGGEGAAGSLAALHDEGMGDKVPGVADYVGRLGLNFYPFPKLELDGWVTVTGPYIPMGEPDVVVPTHALANIQINVPVTDRLQLSLGLDNLTNTRGPELRASGFVTPCQGRTLHLSVHSQF